MNAACLFRFCFTPPFLAEDGSLSDGRGGGSGDSDFHPDAAVLCRAGTRGVFRALSNGRPLTAVLWCSLIRLLMLLFRSCS